MMKKMINGEIFDLTHDEQTERTEMQQQAPDYRQQRVMAYPAIGDQLDAIWKELCARGFSTPAAEQEFNRISGVKQQYPKPTAAQ